jgi:hypothetical protein
MSSSGSLGCAQTAVGHRPAPPFRLGEMSRTTRLASGSLDARRPPEVTPASAPAGRSPGSEQATGRQGPGRDQSQGGPCEARRPRIQSVPLEGGREREESIVGDPGVQDDAVRSAVLVRQGLNRVTGPLRVGQIETDQDGHRPPRSTMVVTTSSARESATDADPPTCSGDKGLFHGTSPFIQMAGTPGGDLESVPASRRGDPGLGQAHAQEPSYDCFSRKHS